MTNGYYSRGLVKQVHINEERELLHMSVPLIHPTLNLASHRFWTINSPYVDVSPFPNY
jgi:hypothetical protein